MQSNFLKCLDKKQRGGGVEFKKIEEILKNGRKVFKIG